MRCLPSGLLPAHLYTSASTFPSILFPADKRKKLNVLGLFIKNVKVLHFLSGIRRLWVFWIFLSSVTSFQNISLKNNGNPFISNKIGSYSLVESPLYLYVNQATRLGLKATNKLQFIVHLRCDVNFWSCQNKTIHELEIVSMSIQTILNLSSPSPVLSIRLATLMVSPVDTWNCLATDVGKFVRS